ncbi:hypothetical protein [Nocardia vaccinii]|uniref:hypothetical protein n=1 Tax=Nocardia vaccinii TaxID=1822 RepID=UPI0012F49CBD|nr:hypothetical protein [Nocardia vaccinii]
MTDFSTMLGSVLASLAKARYMADLETAAIAERYKDHELLERLSIPRIRVPELQLDLPIAVGDIAEGTPSRLQDPQMIADSVRAVIDDELDALGEAGREIRANVPRQIFDQLHVDLCRTIKPGHMIPKETVIRKAESIVGKIISSEEHKRIGSKERRVLIDAVRTRVGEIAELEQNVSSAITVSVNTDDIKERYSPADLARVRVVLREDGVEWESSRLQNGATMMRLSAE